MSTDAAERWREAAKRLEPTPIIFAGDALAEENDRLSDTLATRDRRIAELEAGTAAMLEARARRIAELEAGLRRIVHSVPLEPHPSAEPKFRTIQRIARDLLNRERS